MKTVYLVAVFFFCDPLLLLIKPPDFHSRTKAVTGVFKSKILSTKSNCSIPSRCCLAAKLLKDSDNRCGT